jgi:hypothetical protein
MALRPQATDLRQPMPPHQPMALLEDMPVEHTVARRVEGPLTIPVRPLIPVGSSMSLGQVRRPMTFSGPPLQISHGNGMALPAPIDAVTCASRIPIPCAVMGTKQRAHLPKNERHIVSDPKPRSAAGLFLYGKWSPALLRQGERWAFSTGGDGVVSSSSEGAPRFNRGQA